MWPPARAAWPRRRGRWPRQIRTQPAPEDLAVRLSALGYGGGAAHVVTSHEETLEPWSALPRQTGGERVVIHIDAHGDLKGARGGLIVLDPRSGREFVGPANFLRIAAWGRIVDRIVWVVPDRLWRSPRRLADEFDAFSEEPAEAAEAGLVARMPGSVAVELLPLAALAPAAGPVLARGLALSPEWIDARLYPRLARRAIAALSDGAPDGLRRLRRTLRWPPAPSRSPYPPA